MAKQSENNLITQLRRVLKDAIDYFQSVVELLQARLADMALSSAVFLILIAAAALLAIASFFLLNIALGVWLAHVFGNPGLSIVFLGIFYGLLSLFLGSIALRWLKKLQS